MKKWFYFYPYITDENVLPIYVRGIGCTMQGHIKREDGYEWHQIVYSIHGSGLLSVDGRKYKISAKTAFFLPKGIPHEYYNTSKDWDTHWLVIEGQDLETILSRFNLIKAAVFSLSEINKLDEIFNKIFITLQSDKQYGGFYASAYSYEFLIEFYKITRNKTSEISEFKNHNLFYVLNYITTNYMFTITLEELCTVASVSKEHLCRLFQKHLAMSPVEYINHHRIQVAKELLISTDLQVKDIAKKVGFNDNGYFSKIFKSFEGVTPKVYKYKNNYLMHNDRK